jgi:hypothetical protein
MADIPHIIHYCWFGHTPLPKSAQRCIDSWRRIYPDYEIRAWDESNFDVQAIVYTREAYAARKYAFVSDYARFAILHREGGIYMDTDVEALRSIEPLLQQGALMGIERGPSSLGINPGLILAAPAGMAIYQELLDHYARLHYVDASGCPIPGTIVTHTTQVLQQHGFALEDRRQQVAGITIYPNEYFNPLDDATGRLCVTEQTYSIHWYAKTWVDHYGPLRLWLTRRIHRYFGVESLQWLKRLISRT